MPLLFVSTYCIRPSLILISRRCSGSDEPALAVAPVTTGAGITLCTTPVPARIGWTMVAMLGVMGCGGLVLHAPSSATAAIAKGVSLTMDNPPGLGYRPEVASGVPARPLL